MSSMVVIDMSNIFLCLFILTLVNFIVCLIFAIKAWVSINREIKELKAKYKCRVCGKHIDIMTMTSFYCDDCQTKA